MRMSKIPNDQPCPDCGRWLNRPATVDAVVIRYNKILLVKRKTEPYAGFWALPGGYPDQNETLEQAVVRETLEEAGIQGYSPKQFGVFSDPRRHPNQAISVAYTLQTLTDRIQVGDKQEIERVGWFSFEDLPEMAFDHRQIIDAYHEKVKF